ncbi:MAG: DNA mismatch repair endonuclease MutL [Deltaproteobacteria bacterium]|jgi:DNA mismatch repair protein MutL|nr:DNA mismatch repair endonuclease MutL [Deltaproteobacteria bacterium]
MASRIKLLPESLINRIAAGEVVERPASILKELLDNSLDAGATRLEVDVEDGGNKLIRVTDNGCGLNKEELFMCLERHATSKLSPDSDLMSIATLGFRGEALPSIGSVARLTMISSPSPEGPGHRLRLEGGRLLGLDPAPANQGTVVEVRDVFFNVPARRKFLKAEATEKAHLLDVAQRYALARDEISLVLRDKGKTIFSVEKRQSQKARAAAVMGQEIALSLRPLSFQEGDLGFQGWLAGPEASARNGSLLFIYVLGRPVRDRLLAKAIVQGYGRTLPTGRWPAGVVNVEIDPSRVDVNVHPAKTEVRFREPGRIFQALSDLVAQVVKAPPDLAGPTSPALGPASSSEAALEPAQGPTGASEAALGPAQAGDPDSTAAWGETKPWPLGPSHKPEYGFPDRGPYFRPFTQPGAGPSRGRRPKAGPIVPEPPETPPWVVPPGQAAGPDDGLAPAPAAGPSPLTPPREDWVIGQLGQSYVLAEGEDGLIVVDQHAAHERIVFNRLKRTLANQGLPCQRALFPETLELSAHQILAAQALSAGLTHLGFELEPFGGSTYVLKGFPEILPPSLASEALKEMLAKAQSRLKNLEGAGLEAILEEMTDDWLDSLACRAAIKAGAKMNAAEMAALLRDLKATEAGGFCPHGRPAVAIITYRELLSRFGRT